MKTPLSVSCLILALGLAHGCQRADANAANDQANRAANEAGANDAAAREPLGGNAEGSTEESQTKEQQPQQLQDKSIEPYRRKLLEVAFEAASKFPMNPHKKNRGACQGKVVAAAFELEQPLLAVGMAPKIRDWRRGAAYADFAYYSAKGGFVDNFDRYIKLANKVIEEHSSDPNEQQWRADKVRLKIARALHTHGKRQEAAKMASSIAPASSMAVDEAWADTTTQMVTHLTVEQADTELARIDNSFDAQSFGDQFTSLILIGKLHNHFFDEEGIRKATEERIFDRYYKFPAGLRLTAMAPLVDSYIAHEDRDGAREIIGRMVDLIGQYSWRPEEHIPELTRIAELRIKVGDREHARKDLEATLALYHEKRQNISNTRRCESVRPIALGFAMLGDSEQAQGLLALAIEEGMENENSRPRCFDLVETCVAMAKHEIEPSEELWGRIREITDGLSDPW